MTTMPLQAAIVPMDEVFDLLDQLTPVLDDAPRLHSILVGLCIALVNLYPEITQDQLKQAVEESSEWMCTYLDALRKGELETDADEFDGVDVGKKLTLN